MAKPQKHKEMGLDLTQAELDMDISMPNFGPDVACDYRKVDAELFWSENIAEINQAKALCATCPMMQLCRDYATMFESEGIWGGMTPGERRKYAKGAKLIDRALLIIKRENRALLLSDTPSSQLALRWGVSERQVQRWRQLLGKF